MDILMPQLGETVTEGTVAAWHKKAGDPVEKGEMLLDVETEKVATEITAPISGVLVNINVAAGETVDVGTVLAVVAGDGEAKSARSRPAATAAAVLQTAGAAKKVGLPEKSAGKRLSPAVRRLLSDHGLNVADIEGTGHDGRVTRQDVQNYIRASAGVDQGAAAGRSGDTRIPFDRIRKVTAEHMLRSKATSAHVLQTIDVDFSAVDKVRLAHRDSWRAENGFSLSYLPFVARALCLAISEFPRVNASVDGQVLVIHKAINLAIAVDLDFEGLLAPVVRDADEMKVSELARRFNDLGSRAKAGTLTANDLQGGTYTLSNPGPFGTLFTAPIINQPQVAILSMDAIRKRPVVVEAKSGDTLEIHPVGILAHSFDHRAIDGAYSAAFLNKMKNVIEELDWEQEL